MTVVFLYIQNFLICDSRISDRKRGYFMEFFTQAIETLKVLEGKPKQLREILVL